MKANDLVLVEFEQKVILGEEEDITFTKGDRTFVNVSDKNPGGGWPMIFVPTRSAWYDIVLNKKDNIFTDEYDEEIYARVVPISEYNGYELKIAKLLLNLDNNEYNDEFWDMLKEIHGVLVKYDVYPDIIDLVQSMLSIM